MIECISRRRWIFVFNVNRQYGYATYLVNIDRLTSNEPVNQCAGNTNRWVPNVTNIDDAISVNRKFIISFLCLHHFCCRRRRRMWSNNNNNDSNTDESIFNSRVCVCEKARARVCVAPQFTNVNQNSTWARMSTVIYAACSSACNSHTRPISQFLRLMKYNNSLRVSRNTQTLCVVYAEADVRDPILLTVCCCCSL